MQGKIIKGIAGFYYVQAENESQYECKAKGIFRKDHKKPLVGDEVTIEVLDEEEKKGSITELLPRRSELFRPAVANIDQAVIVFACREPEPNFNLLDRFLVLMEKRNVQVILCFTKADLATAEFKKEVQMIYEPAGYPVWTQKTASSSFREGDSLCRSERCWKINAGKSFLSRSRDGYW